MLLAINAVLTTIAAAIRWSVSLGDNGVAQLFFAEIPLVFCLYSAGFTSTLAVVIGIVAIARGRRRRVNTAIAVGHGALLACLQVVATSS